MRTVQTLSVADAAYIAGLIDGEGTITLSRRHAKDNRQPVVTIVSTEHTLIDFVMQSVGVGKVTSKRVAREAHAPSFTYCIANRQALALLAQTAVYLRSYKRQRAALVLREYVRLTPRNGKYTAKLAREREQFEREFLTLRAR